MSAPHGLVVQPRPAGMRLGFGFLQAASFVASSPEGRADKGRRNHRRYSWRRVRQRTGGGTTGGGAPVGRTTTGGSTTGGSTTGGRTSGTTTTGGNTTGLGRSYPNRGGNSNTMVPGQAYRTNPFNLPRQIVPQVPFSATANQDVLYMLAAAPVVS